MTDIVAAPSRRLRKLWCEWIELHTALNREMPGAVAAPFFSARSPIKCEKRILMVGKATKDGWDVDKSYRDCLKKPVDDAINDRLQQNLKFLGHEGNRKPFWNLFRRLAKFDSEAGLNSVIWSNVAKIGSMKGNPRGDLLSRQANLAERTLRAEISEYRPAVTIFVTGNNPVLSAIINRALGVSNGDWQKSTKMPDVWWRKGPPAALWTRHPQGARREEIDYWMKRVQALIVS